MVKLIALRKACGREYEADASQYYSGEPMEPGYWLVRRCDGSPPFVTTMDDMPAHWIEQIRQFRRLLRHLP